MTNKRIRLPKEGIVGPGEKGRTSDFIDGTSDVEGHGWMNPAPPIDLSPQMPTHGGELFPTDAEDDPEER